MFKVNTYFKRQALKMIQKDVKIIIREVEGNSFGEPRKDLACIRTGWQQNRYSRKVLITFKKADSEEWWERKVIMCGKEKATNGK